jgi:hypothetical protein
VVENHPFPLIDHNPIKARSPSVDVEIHPTVTAGLSRIPEGHSKTRKSHRSIPAVPAKSGKKKNGLVTPTLIY